MRYSETIKGFAENCRKGYLTDLAELIAIPSVSEEKFEASDDAPFGTHCVRALEKMMELCRRYGLRTRTIGNVIGIAEYGEGERELDIVSHLDVQPAGPGWVTDPFTMTADGDTLYGRGVSDDKGPALASLYAVRALIENGIMLNKTVRLVFGTGEEYAMLDMPYYTNAEPFPPFMFTPDHCYPIVNTKKAASMVAFSAVYEPCGTGCRVISVSGGENRGAVPENCTAAVAGISEEVLKTAIEKASQRTGLPFTYEEKEGIFTLTSKGVSTHAIKADKGKNAVTAMLELVCSLPLAECNAHQLIKKFSELFPHGDVAGREAGLYLCDELSGGSLYNLGIFRFEEGKLTAHIRCTLPYSTQAEPFNKLIAAAAERTGVNVDRCSFDPGKHIPLDDPYIEKLLKSYEHHYGEKAYGLAMGGGCYAHCFPHGVAFGCEPYGEDTRMHGAQEFVKLDVMLKSIAVFAQSIFEICG
ncbi:MAG: Sapep family Mn(2+)-dependent dipeptidase [Clostridia bacterium]|nr:Sapep family Mn(2+)-dependent dipeptidase [Clostridia bacterium]